MADSRVRSELAGKATLPEGFGETEPNLPSEWRVASLGDLAVKTFGGGTPSTKKPEFWDGSIPWTTTAIIGAGDTYLEGFQRGITEEGLKGSSAQVAPKHSVLIGTRVGVGKAVVTPFDVAVNQDITVLVPAPNVVPEFLALALKLPSLQRWFSENKRGTTIKGVPRSDVLGLQLTLPPLPEQRAVTHALRTVQKAIETTEKVLEASRELKRSLMNHLFTYGPVSVDEAEQVPLKETTEIGPMPEHWEATNLGSVCDFRGGTQPPKKEFSYEPRDGYVRLLQIRDFETEAHPTYVKASNRLRIVTEDDVLLGRYGASIGKVLRGKFGAINVAIVKSIPQQDLITNDFLYYLFGANAFQSFVRRLGGRSAQAGFNKGELGSFPITLPPRHEQTQITSILLKADRKIRVEESRKATLNVLFKTLLHDLMTAKVRVNDLDLSAVEEMV